jgi:DNA repair protein RadA/Sms
MARAKTHYVCQACGSIQPKWMGRCPDCGEWNTLVETVVEAAKPGMASPAARRALLGRNIPQPLNQIVADHYQRTLLPMDEFNRVLGGGLVPGSLILIGGDPGIGKSTLLLQMSAALAVEGEVLYISGEESPQQIKLRATRLGITSDRLLILTETNMTVILEHIRQNPPKFLVVDSIQTVYLEELQSAPGSVSQVRECAARFQEVAKGQNIPVFLIGHVTKTGIIAGPRVLEHIVDTVLYLEGDRFHAYRVLRSVKNRFGATNEIGIFEMGDVGLSEVLNPSEIFLAERLPNASGSAIAVTLEGTRPLLVEVQALASTTSFGNPRRTANGVDINRLLLTVAVLTKRVGIRLADQDVFVNVIGGLQISEPASDLAVAAALASSVRNIPVAADVAIVGEVGLSGELRAVGHMETRLKEAAKLGFKRCLLPASSQLKQISSSPPLELLKARSLAEALEMALIH